MNLISKSNLNFKIEESPFTLTITIRKSFITNKNGTHQRSGLESSNISSLKQNPDSFPFHSNLKQASMPKTINNREDHHNHKLPFINPMDQTQFSTKSCKYFTTPSVSPLPKTHTLPRHTPTEDAKTLSFVSNLPPLKVSSPSLPPKQGTGSLSFVIDPVPVSRKPLQQGESAHFLPPDLPQA